MSPSETPFQPEVPGVDLNGEELFSGKVLANWAFDGEQILTNVLLEVHEGVVTTFQSEVDSNSSRFNKHWKVGAILPGFFNAHCHLDLSGIVDWGEYGHDFTEWLEDVRQWRPNSSTEELSSAVRLGLSQLARAGTTGVIDFSADAMSLPELKSSAFNGIVLRELIGWSSPRDQEAISLASDWIEEQSKNLPAHIQLGLAPHAPYSTSKHLLRETVSRFPRSLYSIHLCEDPGEREFLESGKGPFKDFLNRLGLEVQPNQIPQVGPVEYLNQVGLLTPQTLLVHCNDLNDRDLDLISASRASIVFCPNTHHYFDRPQHPLPQILERGIPVGLGTDSSASHFGVGSLSMFSELHRVREYFPDIDPSTLFKLSVGGLLGEPWRPDYRIQEKHAASFSLWCDPGTTLTGFLDSPSSFCFFTVSRGRQVYKNPDI